MYSHKTVSSGMFGCLFMWVIGALAMSFWTDRNMDWLCTMIKGVPVDVPWYLSALLSLLLPPVFLANVIAEIARCCM